MEITTKVQEAIRSLQSKGQIVRKVNDFGAPEFYLKTEGVSIDSGEKFNLEIPLALTDEGRDLGTYLTLYKLWGSEGSERSLRL